MRTGSLLGPEAQERCKTEIGAMKYRDHLLDLWIGQKNVADALTLAEQLRRVQEIIDENWRRK